MLLFEQVGHPALPDWLLTADDGVIAAAQIGRVDRQVKALPRSVGPLLREALLDGVLCEPENAEDQVARVRMARMDRQLVAVLGAAAHFVDVGEVQVRGDTLRI